MPDPRAPLDTQWTPGPFGAVPDGGPGVRVARVTGLTIVQVAGWPGGFDGVASRLPALTGAPLPEAFTVAASHDGTTVLWTGPERLWIVTPDAALPAALAAAFAAAEAAVTDLGHGRAIFRISGPKTRAVLAKGLPVDLHPRAFPADAVAMSVIHHMDVLVHRRDTPDGDTFDLYVARSSAGSFWDWLSQSAAEFGAEALA